MKTSSTPAPSPAVSAHAAALAGLVGNPGRVLTEPAAVSRLSRDFYWYSPILREQLDGKSADIVVRPISVPEVQAVLAFAHSQRIPVTARGAGTGNYGQAVPLAGGIILDLTLFDALEDISAEGVALCRPGLRLGVLEAEARRHGWELRCYPSTIAKATVGGFLGGGSGGIGSVRHGGLRDFGTVRSLELVTMEESPRVVRKEGDAVHDILHAWGTNGVMTCAALALAPAVEWCQVAATFPAFDTAFLCAQAIAGESAWIKRLVTLFEWPIPSFFTPVLSLTKRGQALLFCMVARAQASQLATAIVANGGTVTHQADYNGLKTKPLLSDYTWNHTTLWAMKADPAYTYLQCGFSHSSALEQLRTLRKAFGQEILFHIEFMKTGDGAVVPGGIPLVHYATKERLGEIIDLCRAVGISVANPHVNHVEGGGRYRAGHGQLRAKLQYDPRGLLNPGKMMGFTPGEGTP